MILDISLDHFLDGSLVIRQPKNGYRAGSDPIFLAASVQVGAEEHVLDMGCGVGTASLCLLRRWPEARITGLDIQADLLDLYAQNAQANHVQDRVTIQQGSVLVPPATIPYHHYHTVITNPPWYPPGSIQAPTATSKAIGHLEEVSLADWLRQAVRFLRPRGRLALVHRADRLGDILAALHALRVGEICVMPLYPKAGSPAGRVVVTARKDVKTPLKLCSGIILHHNDGSYGDKAQDILRRGGCLW